MSKKNVKVADLETAQVEKTIVVGGDYNAKALLEKEVVFEQGNTYSNYDAEKEPQVQESLKALQGIFDSKGKTDKTDIVLLLGKYWNDRNTFKIIKKRLEQMAQEEGVPFDIYLEDLRKEVDVVDIAPAISRIKYAFNYLKPREGRKPSVMQQVSIGGKIYEISDRKYHEIKITNAGNKEAIKQALLKEAKLVEIDNF